MAEQFYVRLFNTSDVPLPGQVRSDFETARRYDCGRSAEPVAFEPSADEPGRLVNTEPVTIVVRTPFGQPKVHLMGVGVQERAESLNPERAARLPEGRAGQLAGAGDEVSFAVGELVM